MEADSEHHSDIVFEHSLTGSTFLPPQKSFQGRSINLSVHRAPNSKTAYYVVAWQSFRDV